MAKFRTFEKSVRINDGESNFSRKRVVNFPISDVDFRQKATQNLKITWLLIIFVSHLVVW